MSTNTGFTNEKEIANQLDGHKIADLNPNLQAFITEIFQPTAREKSTQIIHAERTKNTAYKPDLIIKFAGRRQNISIKSGQGNSVHQEKIQEFVKYAKNSLNASPEVLEALLFFHWGDGTLDGSAPVSRRLKAREIIEKYLEKVAKIQEFFNQHVDQLLERFLSTGTADISHVDWIYYGDYQNGDWHSIDEVYRHLKPNSGKILSVGGLNYQTYGRSLHGTDDNRRQDIQLKWSNMAAYFLVGQKSVIDLESKIKGDNSHGFRNVDALIENLNDKKLSEIPRTLQNFVIEIFPKIGSKPRIIHAEKVKKGYKGDFLIWLDDDRQNIKNIAVATGAGNSVHQENIYTFCQFLKDDLKFDQQNFDRYLRFHFADGTNDNSGDISARQKASEYKQTHTTELVELGQSFSAHAREILARFVKQNPADYPDVDYFFYGDAEQPIWAKIDDLIKAESSKMPNSRAALAIGDVSIQAWNRSLNGTADRKRLDVQAKWNNLQENISQTHQKTIAKNKATQGLDFEYKFTADFNQSERAKNTKIFLANVSYNQISKLAGAKVRPKSDCYAVRIQEDINILLQQNNYLLTEEILLENQIQYEVIPKSGISIKLPESKSYTLQKLSFTTFQNIFAKISPSYFIAALLFVKPSETEKNNLILATFGKTIDELCADLEIEKPVSEPVSELETLKILKSTALAKIKQLANEDKNIYNTLCFGSNMFEDPYSATYIFENNKIYARGDYRATINVTTGSGRSKGKYTLAFK